MGRDDSHENMCIGKIITYFRIIKGHLNHSDKLSSNIRDQMSVAEVVVCVTGASGFIASWLVKLLLQHGYTVKANVRDPNDPKKTHHLVSLDGAKERLHLFKADLLDEGCFDSIVDGCHGVFHAATPVIVSAADPQAEIIEPAVKGTLNVLKSCAKVGSIKRVVITSSMASVAHNGKLTPDAVVDETCFSDPLLLKEIKRWYPLSKTLAEEAAWKFAKENEIDLVTMHPGFVFGPLLQPNLNFSSELILNLTKDVQKIKTRFRSQLLRYQKEKAKGLGVSFIPLEVSLRDAVESLKEKGFLSI
ncbi:hypothetical protein PTKIN_Ptkin12aG0025700 [Pterospermum kingtungense]